MRLYRESDEVLYADEPLVLADAPLIGRLKELARGNARRRVRLCAHPAPEDRLHEMFIVLGKGSYIRPHRHPGKSESFHVIEGEADLLLFDDTGTPVDRIGLGGYPTGGTFYFRIDRARFHSVVVLSESFVFHETTNGPFNRNDTEFALWAPGEQETDAGRRFMRKALQEMESRHDA